MKMGITVEDAMKIGGLTKSKVVSGHSGLKNIIKYVSVIELPEVDDWIRGEELFLTAFYSIGDNLSAQLQLLRTMKARNVSALGICYPGRHYTESSSEFLQLSDQLGIPIIEIPDEVAYVDIISPITERIHNSYGELLTKVLTLHQLFPEWIEQGMNFSQITNKLSEYLNHSIAITNERFDFLSLAANTEKDKLIIRNWVETMKSTPYDSSFKQNPFKFNNQYLYVSPIRIKKETLGYHFILGNHPLMDNILLNIISTNLVLYLSHPERKDEANAVRKENLINDLFSDRLEINDIRYRAGQIRWEIDSIIGIALVEISGEFNVKEEISTLDGNLDWFDSMGHIGFFIYKNQAGTNTFNVKLESLLKQAALNPIIRIVYTIDKENFLKNGKYVFEHLTKLLLLQRKIPYMPQIMDSNRFPLLSLLDHAEHKSSFIQLIEPLIRNDIHSDTELFTTFVHSLFSSDNGTITEALHIHKNTLNYRRRRVVEILGVNPFSPSQIAHYQTAVYVYYLKGNGSGEQ